MPKKYQPSYITTKPTAAPHTSLTSSSSSSSLSPPQHKEAAKSVNDRIRDYRAQAATSTARSISSNEDILRALTAEDRVLPAGPAQAQAQARRARTRNTRLAGPAAPASWVSTVSIRGGAGLEASIHAPPHFLMAGGSDRSVHSDQCMLPLILPGQPSPAPRSLRAASLRVIAHCMNVESVRETADDVRFTPKMKMQILEQMALQGCLDKEVVAALLDPWTGENGRVVSGGDMISHIYLGPLIQNQTGWTFLMKILRQDQPPAASTYIPESWDDKEAKADLGSASRMIVLPHLTHLSLSGAVCTNWTSLLLLGSKYNAFSQLTHLDLSQWPTPSTWSSQHIAVLGGATPSRTVYAHTNTHESGIVNFNSLGKSCRCLVWLGLQGCESWIDLLGETVERRRNESDRSRSTFQEGPLKRLARNVVFEVDWVGAWRGLQTIHFGTAHRNVLEFDDSQQLPLLSLHIMTLRLDAGLPGVRFEMDT